MTKKEFGRVIAFALVVCLMLILLCEIFELKDSTNYSRRWNTYYGLEENTIDALWIGTSGVDRYWIASKAYEEYGMTVFPLATDAMPAWLFTHVLDEALKTQNPELIIIDVRAFGQGNNNENVMDTRARRVLDAMDFFSVNRLKAAFKTMNVIQRFTKEEHSFDISYLLPYIKFHTKWKEDDFTLKDNMGSPEHQYMGFYMAKDKSLKRTEQAPVVYDREYYRKLDAITKDALYDLLDYIEEKDLNVLFVDTPHLKNDKQMGRANTIYDILEEHDIPYINFCQTDAEGNFVNGLSVEATKDFYDDGHINYYGAENFTDVFAKYLHENYELADRRNDEAVKKDWDGIYAVILDKIASWTKTKK